jgi:hypothetical protein
VDVTIGGITVATAPKAASGSAVAIHDVPASVRGVGSAKYLLVALCNDSYDKMTTDALTLLSNSIHYLLNGTQFEHVTTSTLEIKTSGISFDGKIIRNIENQELNVYTLTGSKMISSNKDIDMSKYSKGIYIVQSSKETIKIVLTK